MTVPELTCCPRPETLGAFRAGRLPEEALEAVAAHADRCPACRAALDAPPAAPDDLELALRGL